MKGLHELTNTGLLRIFIILSLSIRIHSIWLHYHCFLVLECFKKWAADVS